MGIGKTGVGETGVGEMGIHQILNIVGKFILVVFDTFLAPDDDI